MKYQELISTVARLGFENEIEDEIAFKAALSRALYTIFSDRPSIARRSLVKKDHGTLPVAECFTHTPGNSETFLLPSDGSAFSFKIYGEGTYSLRTGGITTECEISGNGEAIRDFYSGSTEITFFGECAYTVTSLVAFKNVFSKRESDIPLFEETNLLNLTELIPDFLAPEEPPKNSRGEVIAGAEIEGERLILPPEFSGEVHLTYRRKPKIPIGISPNEEIDVPTECTELLPLIVASYVWLDDDPERARYYLSLYKDGINGLRRFTARQISPSYETNGWA